MSINISQSLIVISIIFSFFAFQNEIYYNFWMSEYFIEAQKYPQVILQFLMYQFLHGDIFHLLFNSIVLYYFWWKLEQIMKKSQYLTFFLLNSIFVALSLLYFSSGITVWISGFWMAIMAFYTWYLWKIWNTEYKWGITALVINVFIWIWTDISLIWHLSWAIFGFMYFFLYDKIYKKYQ